VALLAAGILIMNLPSLMRGRSPRMTIEQAQTIVDSAPARPGVPPPDSLQLLAALARVNDPELDLSVVEMGLVERLELDSLGNVKVLMLLTTPECPYGLRMGGEAVKELKLVPGVHRIEVRLDPKIEWRPERMSEEGRKRFKRLFGDGSDAGR
jgi:metal-sulfur cluster biosynthetic enzyme